MSTRRRALRALSIAIALGVLALLAVGAFFPQAALDLEFARLRWRADAIERTIQLGDHRVVYLEAGQGTPLVLLHGYTGGKENWLALMPELGRRWRVIAPDLPGWGESERRAGADYGYAAQAARIAALLPLLSEGPVVLVGHSMGGGIAALLAAEHPELVSRLVLMDAGGVRFRDNEFGAAVLRGENPFAVSDRASLDRFFATVFVDPPFVPWPADRALITQRIAQEPFETSVLDSIGRGPDAFLPQVNATRIAMPTLLLWCAADRVIDVSASEIYREAIRGSTVVLFDGCNHMPMMELPRETAAALEEFAR